MCLTLTTSEIKHEGICCAEFVCRALKFSRIRWAGAVTTVDEKGTRWTENAALAQEKESMLDKRGFAQSGRHRRANIWISACVCVYRAVDGNLGRER